MSDSKDQESMGYDTNHNDAAAVYHRRIAQINSKRFNRRGPGRLPEVFNVESVQQKDDVHVVNYIFQNYQNRKNVPRYDQSKVLAFWQNYGHNAQ